MVNIHLRKMDGSWMCALAIPLEDIGRLSLRPLKWLRFATFAALGVKGHLYDAPRGNVVDYGNVSLADLADNYYFSLEGEYHFVDPHGINDRITTSSFLTHRRFDFRCAVALRDGDRCVVTIENASTCDAAHVIRHSKGDEYIQRVIADRRVLYEDEDPEIFSMDINSTQNGILLRKDLHSQFGRGDRQFLKTPNFALDPADIPTGRFETGTMPASRVTMQHMCQLVAGFQFHKRISWPTGPVHLRRLVYSSILCMGLPSSNVGPSMTFDKCGEHHNERFQDIPPVSRSDCADDDEDKDEGDIEPGDTSDGDHEPQGVGHRHRIHHKSEESEFSRAMDDAFYLAMIFRGAPQACRWQGRYKRSIHVKRGERRSKGGWKRVHRHTILPKVKITIFVEVCLPRRRERLWGQGEKIGGQGLPQAGWIRVGPPGSSFEYVGSLNSESPPPHPPEQAKAEVRRPTRAPAGQRGDIKMSHVRVRAVLLEGPQVVYESRSCLVDEHISVRGGEK
ncbi:hypothetical protein BC826DRAFT_1179330 [Russula brevipes]|nr:hypothetical protein BC826DRAFT_1179330 [Russula brevipes]